MDLLFEEFADSYARQGITLDSFQREACLALLDGHDVLVSAPTGSGKSVPAVFSAYLALARGRRCVYTAPIKALSNQKYLELSQRFGSEYVGLLTGDTQINADAQVIVATTEVLRNMLLDGSSSRLGDAYVVLDELHYLADPSRGPVWEEIILSLPEHMQLLGLSATIANIDQLAGWISSLRRSVHVVSSSVRPVPLQQYWYSRRNLGSLRSPLEEGFSSGLPAKQARRVRKALEVEQAHGREGTHIGSRVRADVLETLREADMLPAIEFIFSRRGADAACHALRRSNITLVSKEESRRIAEIIAEFRATLSHEDLQAIGFSSTERCLRRGFAVHHAGVLPKVKTLIERLMNEGLLKLVYATGTLALGIDMPVRTVVLESLHRFNGEGFVPLSQSEYVQLIGRAGRRGKDELGNAVIILGPQVSLEQLSLLTQGRSGEVTSAYSISYNTIVNLIAAKGVTTARSLLTRSFSQFQRDEDIRALLASREECDKRIAHERAKIVCSRGDFFEYLSLWEERREGYRQAKSEAVRRVKRQIRESVAHGRPGWVYACVRKGTRSVCYMQLLSTSPEGELHVLDSTGEFLWLSAKELASPLRTLGPGMKLTSLRSRARRIYAAEVAFAPWREREEAGLDDDLVGMLEVAAHGGIDHPCASCPHRGKHMRQARVYQQLLRERTGLEREIAEHRDAVAREFDACVKVLLGLGLLQGSGEDIRVAGGASMLQHLHTELDLTLYMCLLKLKELTPAQLAGWASMFLDEERLGTRKPVLGPPRKLAQEALEEREFVREREAQWDLERPGEVYPGGVEMFKAWADGASLAECLRESKLAAGDFINIARRLADLLGQLARAGEGTWIGPAAQKARNLVTRPELDL